MNSVKFIKIAKFVIYLYRATLGKLLYTLTTALNTALLEDYLKLLAAQAFNPFKTTSGLLAIYSASRSVRDCSTG
ncbi:hypothetical protein CFPU101_23220 [Chroococcus sp. FPU101]|nr:hypothetical protein CFPU101_23220 [Chroococcus sp. FPU101]